MIRIIINYFIPKPVIKEENYVQNYETSSKSKHCLFSLFFTPYSK